MNIRDATLDDAEGIWDIHVRSIRELCSADYTPAQIKAWTGHRTVEDYRKRIKSDPFYVAEIYGKTVGFARFRPSTNELCSVFVDPDHVRQGVGTALLRKACEDGARRGLTHFWLDASLTAVPFYESGGFVWEQNIVHTFSGVDLECVRMTRCLSCGDEHPVSSL
jgi:putative acetyltransferase